MPALAMMVAAVLAFSSTWLVETLLGSSYRGGATVLTVLALAAIPAVLNQPLFVALQFLGRDGAVALILASVVLLQLALVAVLAPHVGALSCALAVLAAQVLQLVSFLLLAAHEIRTPRSVPRPIERSTEKL